MDKQFLLKIIEICGGQVALANKLGVKQGHVYGWLNENKTGISPIYVIPACKAVNWQVTPHQLRPDLYPHPQDGLPAHIREVA
jgi:DNA-binding transcriptional regulator YdaS (Cro superfamily)